MENCFEKELLRTHCHSELWNGQIACFETDASSAYEPNLVHTLQPLFIYSLVERGDIELRFEEHTMHAHKSDMVTYVPGQDLNTVKVSQDYKALTLYVTDDFATDNAMQRKILQTAFFPMLQYRTPILSLLPKEARLLRYNLLAIRDHIKAEGHPFRQEAIQTIYSLFLIDLMGIQNNQQQVKASSPREEHIFVAFMDDLRKDFLHHHDLAYYASRLCISTTYLSRVVKHLTGCTVQDYLGRMLLMEACSLLRYGDVPMSVIASRLHFADQASFSKFFSRRKGLSPVAYRRKYRI